ncbi:stearoyl-CoA desaturase 5-like protein [Dinothrombium tinctorium]|nr:stearoyl-CoA desaturase 5-like protein [Dinothrombium tinctorium]
MPPSTKNHLELREYANSHGTDVSPVNRHDKKLVKSEGRKTGDVQSNALDKRSSPFIYVKYGDWSVVWRNVIIFTILHLLYFYAVYLLLKEGRYKPWLLGWWFALWGGMGITAGAHRLWSHKSYKARLPLRIFLMLGQCIAGQNDLYTWCRDHRVHHKFSETDADPHNSLRGYFFAHMGWLLMKKHPDVMTKGKQVELHDLLADPVIRFQRK